MKVVGLVIGLCFGLGIRAFALSPEETILKEGGPESKVVINKAFFILAQAEVFASRAVGDIGTFTNTSWALTVLVRYDKDAKASFESILFAPAEEVTPEARLFALVGLFLVAPEERRKYQPKFFGHEKLNQPIERLDGCNGERGAWLTFGLCLESLLSTDGKARYRGADAYLIEDLPPLYQTTRVGRTRTE